MASELALLLFQAHANYGTWLIDFYKYCETLGRGRSKCKFCNFRKRGYTNGLFEGRRLYHTGGRGEVISCHNHLHYFLDHILYMKNKFLTNCMN